MEARGGARTKFWIDKWADDVPLKYLHPSFALSENKEGLVKDGLVKEFVIQSNFPLAWNLHLGRNLRETVG